MKNDGSGWDPDTKYRRTDPLTSAEAAHSVRRIRSSQEAILKLLDEKGPMTDQQIFAFQEINLLMSPSGARTRRDELVKAGLVRDSGALAKTKANRRTIVWEIVPPKPKQGLLW